MGLFCLWWKDSNGYHLAFHSWSAMIAVSVKYSEIQRLPSVCLVPFLVSQPQKNHWHPVVWRTMLFCNSSLSVSSGDTLLQGVDLLPMLIQTVEKAASQSTQVPMVTEGVAAALLICRMSVIEGQTGKVTKHLVESGINRFWGLTLLDNVCEMLFLNPCVVSA